MEIIGVVQRELLYRLSEWLPSETSSVSAQRPYMVPTGQVNKISQQEQNINSNNIILAS